MNIKKIFIVLFLFAIQILSIAAQNSDSQLPDTPGGRIVVEYIRAFNSGDDKIRKDFINKYFARSALQKVSIEERLTRIRATQEALKEISKEYGRRLFRMFLTST